MRLENSTFALYAAKFYDNPSCHSVEEFNEDLRRFQYIRKLFNRYVTGDELKHRLVLNHLIIVFNCFGEKSPEMLFFKLHEHHTLLKTFLSYLNRLPETISYSDKTIDTTSILEDSEVKQALEQL